MNWKKTYILLTTFLILDFIFGLTIYPSAGGFSFAFKGFRILPTLSIVLHLFYVIQLHKAITVEKVWDQRLKVLEYLNYGVVSIYIYWCLSGVYGFILWSLDSFDIDTAIHIYFSINWIFNSIIIFLSFRTYQLRKKHLGKYSTAAPSPVLQNNLQETFSTTEERLALCKLCTNRQFNMEKGLLCGLNQEKPSFSSFCIDYYVDAKAQEKQKKLSNQKQKKGFFGSWKAALLMSILGFVRAAMRGFNEPMGLIFLALGIGWFLLALFGNNDQD